jgi:hypothetical protein
MAEYQLTATDVVIRTLDQVHIPNDPANRDRAEYEQWLAGGGEPDPYVPPPEVPPEAAPETTVLYDHENRLRSLEGAPPLTLGEFLGNKAAPQPKRKRK